MATKAKFATCNTADDDLIVGDLPAIDRLVAAFVRIRGLDRLDDAVISRYWLATDMGVTVEDLDDLLSLLRWRGLIELPNDHLVTVRDATVLKAIALAGSSNATDDVRIFSQPIFQCTEIRSELDCRTEIAGVPEKWWHQPTSSISLTSGLIGSGQIMIQIKDNSRSLDQARNNRPGLL